MEVDDDVSEGELFAEDEDDCHIKAMVSGLVTGAVRSVLNGVRSAYIDHIVETNLEGESEDRLVRFLSADNQLLELHQRLNERVESKIPVPEPTYAIARNHRSLLVKSIMDLRLQRIKEEEKARPEEEAARIAAVADSRKRKVRPVSEPEITKDVKVVAMHGKRQMALLYLATDAADHREKAARYESGDKDLKRDVKMAMDACLQPPEDKPGDVENAIRQSLILPGIVARNRAIYFKTGPPSSGDGDHIYWVVKGEICKQRAEFMSRDEEDQRALLSKWVSIKWNENPDHAGSLNAEKVLDADDMMQAVNVSGHTMHELVLLKVDKVLGERLHQKMLQTLAATLEKAPKHQLEEVLDKVDVRKGDQFNNKGGQMLTIGEKIAAFKYRDDTQKKHLVVRQAVALKLKEFPELLHWALETSSINVVEQDTRRQAYKTLIHPRHNQVRALIDERLRARESIPVPKFKGLNGEVSRPLSERARDEAAEAAAERNEKVIEERRKQAAAYAQIVKDYPDFGAYAFEVQSAPILRQKEAAAKAVVHGMMLKVMRTVRGCARSRDRTKKCVYVDCDPFNPQGAEFSDDEEEPSAKSARRAPASSQARAPASELAPTLFAPRSPSPTRETCPSKVSIMEQRIGQLKDLMSGSTLPEHEKSNVQHALDDLAKRLPKKRKAANEAA